MCVYVCVCVRVCVCVSVCVFVGSIWLGWDACGEVFEAICCLVANSISW